MASTQLTASPVSVSARSLASLEGLRASSVKFSSFGTLKPGTFRQVQFRPLVVKAAVVIPPKVLTCSLLCLNSLLFGYILQLSHWEIRVLKINEAEEKTVGGILLPSTAQSKHQVGEGEVVAVGEETTIGRPKAGITLLIGLQILYTKYAGTEVDLNEEATEFYRSGTTTSEMARWLMDHDPVKAEHLIKMDKDEFMRVLMKRFGGLYED
ncbi:unnamed protein product [Arabis nemorensis]|uniref:Uncharacterized protein n=1 Tax=Arabis nemorensis TaxID=586526 RepID=A0A565CSV8_9BRAS|nr:unnamed protein product [Arabis nemorensis]